MKAVVYERYGSPDVLSLEEVPRPVPGDDEVLVRVHATTVNRSDCGVRSAKPFIVRFFSGLFTPKQKILGSEFSGVVESIGATVTQFAVGDRVFGVNANKLGAHAEYLCMSQDAPLAAMPTKMTFEEAAAVCDGVVLALMYMKQANVEPGQRILIYGASGSIGTAAVQLAKHFGAEVTAVCDTKNVEIVRALGADKVVDYTTHDYVTNDGSYDVILDAVGKDSFRHCKGALREDGIFASSDLGFLWQNPVLALVTKVVGSKKVIFPIPTYTKAEVLYLKDLIEQGKYKAVIDRCYPLEQVVEATRYVETEQKTGNVVLTVFSEEG